MPVLFRDVRVLPWLYFHVNGDRPPEVPRDPVPVRSVQPNNWHDAEAVINGEKGKALFLMKNFDLRILDSETGA
jgi:hypothetical protein